MLILRIIDYNYAPASNYFYSGPGVPRRVVAVGNGGYIVGFPPQVMTRVQDIQTGATTLVDAYPILKTQHQQSGGIRLTKQRVAVMMQGYIECGSFYADGWEKWPNLNTLKPN